MRKYTSDQHYGHVRISELADRPFRRGEAGVPAMNLELLWRFNQVVGHDDETWHLGDFAMGKIAETLPAVRLLNGKHVLVAGNHDRCSECYTRKPEARAEWLYRYAEAGFDDVWNDHQLVPTDEIAGQQVEICHFPYRGGGDSRAVERYAEFRMDDQGGWLLCGHVHNRWRQRGRMINVGVDAWGGYPVSTEQIAELIEAGPNDLAPLPW